MSIKVMSAVYESDLTDIYDVAVMLALAKHADEHGRCYPSIQRIARMARIGERAVYKIISRLKARGYLIIEAGGGRGKSNRYLVVPNPAPETGFEKQCFGNTESDDTETLNPETKNPEPGSDEWSVTITEPSEVPPLVPPQEKPAKARLPEDWALSDEGWAYARSKQIPDEDISDEARGFHAYWTDRTDREARKSERGWEQCWQGWVRRIAPRYQRRAMAGPSDSRGYGQGGSIASLVARRRALG